MKLTNEEIEAARETISAVFVVAEMEHVMGSEAFRSGHAALDALCAAAREDSLVGRKVRLKNANPGVLGRVIKHNKLYCILWNGGTRSHDYDRDDFELLEGDHAE